VGKQNLNAADRIIVISGATKDYVLRLGAKPSKVTLIYTAWTSKVPLNRWQTRRNAPQTRIPKDAVVVLTVRRLVTKTA
jgi:hypothetical protein